MLKTFVMHIHETRNHNTWTLFHLSSLGLLRQSLLFNWRTGVMGDYNSVDLRCISFVCCELDSGMKTRQTVVYSSISPSNRSAITDLREKNMEKYIS